MSNDVLITPASRKVEFKDSSANVDAKIETDASGNLVITNTGGDISIGDTTSDIFVGDGTNNIDIVFEQDGEIRGTTGVTVTLGQSDSNIRMATDLNLNNNDITNVGDLTVTGNLTITGDINSYNVTDLDVSDKTITLGVGQTEANSGDSGIIISGSSASILWDESNDRWSFNKGISTSGVINASATSASSFYAASFTRSSSGLVTPDIWGSSSTLVLGTSSTDERLALSTAGALIYGRALVRQSSSDQNTSQDSASIPDTTGAEIMRFEGGYTNGQYTTEFAKVDRSGNLPLYVRQSLGTANSFSNIARFGGHGQTNGTDVFAVFGGARVGGRVTADNLTLNSISTQSSEATVLTINGSNVVGKRDLGSNAFNSTTIPTSQQITATALTSSNDLGSGTASAFGNGWYKWGNSQPSNAPDDYAIMYELNDGGQPQQWVMAYGNTANNVDLYARRRTGGTWDSTWTQFWSSNDFSSTNVSNWNTAYGWGDHASGGYAPTASPTFTGELTIPNKIIHSGDTDTYFQFQAANQARIVAGNAEVTEWRSDRMQMNNKSITFPVWNNFADTSLSDIAYNSLNAPIHITSTGVGNTDKYLPFLQGSATHDQGYRTSYVLGGFKKATTGAAWGDGQTGFFMAMGGNDSYPTKEFRFTWDGRIWYTDAGSSTYLDFDTSNTIKFIANGGQRMEITGGGVTLNDNLAVGGNQLENIGNAYFNEYLYHNGDTDTYIRIQDNSWTFRTGGGDRLVIDNTNLTVNANLNLHTESSTGTNSIHLPRGGQITFYGDNSAHHSIASTNNSNAVTDDLRISSYGAVYVDLDSNSNNSSAADFVISRHNATANLFKVDGETGAGYGTHSYPNAAADGVSLMSYAQGTVPINQGVVQIRSVGKTGWAPGDEMGSIDFYNDDGSGIGARTHARIVSVNSQGNGTSTTTYNSNIEFYTSEYNTALQTVPALTIGQDNSVSVGNGSDAASCLKLMPADDGTSDDLQFYNGTTRMGEIGTQDTTWLRINQSTAKNIYTPRYIRADNGFFVDGNSKGINGSGNFVGGTITGASDANVSNWDTAYGWGDHGTEGYLTSHQDISGKANLSGATFTGNVQVNANVYANNYDVNAGDTYGLRFWNGSNSYKIYMSQDGASGAGRVPGETTSDYNMYFRMTGGTNRGFAFQSSTGTPHSGIDSTGNIRTIGNIYIGSDSAGDNYLFIDKVATGTNGIIFRNGGGNKCKILQDSSEFLQFHTNDAQAMEINEAGDVNITKDNAVLKFGSPGTNGVAGCWASLEGNTDTSGEGSGRLFFREHNSTTSSMDAYGMSLGYRGGATALTTAGGNSWTGLAAIGNGQWGMWGHDGSDTGALIMYGDRAATFVDFASNNIQGITDAYIADQIIHTGDTNTYMQFHAADQWRVVTGGSERLEVNNTRTTLNNSYLQVTGSTSHLVPTTTATAATTRIGLTATHKAAVVFDTSSTGTTATRRIYAIENNQGANLRIGNPDYPNAFNVTSTGNISSTGDVIAYSSSDRRFKDNINPISNPIEKINKLSGNTFEWNDNQETYEKGMKDVGVIAQEVEEVLPEIVDTRDDGYKAVKYEKIVALLIEGMKEQQEQIDKLTKQVQELKEN